MGYYGFLLEESIPSNYHVKEKENQNVNISIIKGRFARQTISRVLSFKLIICLDLRLLLSSSD